MIEIQIGANQIKKLSSEGLPNTKLLIQNQGRDVMYIFKSATAPTLSTPALNLFNWQSVEVDNSGGEKWWESENDSSYKDIWVHVRDGRGVALFKRKDLVSLLQYGQFQIY